MSVSEPAVGTRWKHKETGKLATITAYGKMLSDSHWVNCYTYQVEGNNQDWTRDIASFHEKFDRTK